MINLVPGAVQDAMLAAHAAAPDLFGLDEQRLYRVLRERGEQPTATDNRLRILFWREYDIAQQSGKKISMGAVWGPICHQNYFYSTYLKRPSCVAWLLTMPVAYETKIKEMLEFSLGQMREILEMDNIDAKGRPNVKLMELKAKIHALVELRERGAVVQKVEQKSLSVSTTATAKELADMTRENSMEDIDRRIKELEGRDRSAARMNERYGPKATDDGVHDAEFTPIGPKPS
jgi:hypothetical protein